MPPYPPESLTLLSFSIHFLSHSMGLQNILTWSESSVSVLPNLCSRVHSSKRSKRGTIFFFPCMGNKLESAE